MIVWKLIARMGASEYCVCGGCLTVTFGASHGRRMYSLGAIFWSKGDYGLSSSNRLTSLDVLSMYDCLIISYNFFGNFVPLEVLLEFCKRCSVLSLILCLKI